MKASAKTSNGNLSFDAGLLLLVLVLFLPAFLFCLPRCGFQVGVTAAETVAFSLVFSLIGRVEVYVLSGPLSCSHRGPTDAGPSLLNFHEIGIIRVGSLSCSHRGPTDADPSVLSLMSVIIASATLSSSHETGNKSEEFSELAGIFPGSYRARVGTDALLNEDFFWDPWVTGLMFWHDHLRLEGFFHSGRSFLNFAKLHHEGSVSIHVVHSFIDGALDECLHVVFVMFGEVRFGVLAVIGFPGVRGRQGQSYPAPAPSKVFLLGRVLLALHSVQCFLHLCEPFIQGFNGFPHALHLLVLFFEHFLEEGYEVFVLLLIL